MPKLRITQTPGSARAVNQRASMQSLRGTWAYHSMAARFQNKPSEMEHLVNEHSRRSRRTLLSLLWPSFRSQAASLPPNSPGDKWVLKTSPISQGTQWDTSFWWGSCKVSHGQRYEEWKILLQLSLENIICHTIKGQRWDMKCTEHLFYAILHAGLYTHNIIELPATSVSVLALATLHWKDLFLLCLPH